MKRAGSVYRIYISCGQSLWRSSIMVCCTTLNRHKKYRHIVFRTRVVSTDKLLSGVARCFAPLRLDSVKRLFGRGRPAWYKLDGSRQCVVEIMLVNFYSYLRVRPKWQASPVMASCPLHTVLFGSTMHSSTDLCARPRLQFSPRTGQGSGTWQASPRELFALAQLAQ